MCTRETQKKTGHDIKFTPWADTQHRDSLQQFLKMQTINKNNKKQQTVKSRSYHIIREHLMFNKKNHKAYKHMENYGIFKVKKEFNRNF